MGMRLQLLIPLFLIPARLRNGWFKFNGKILELHFEPIAYIESMEANAFEDECFKSITILRLVTSALSINVKARYGLFNNFDALTSLTIIGSIAFDKNLLNHVSSTLTELTIYSSKQVDFHEIRSEMPKLEYLKLEINLQGTLAHTTFAGLPALTILDLSNCELEAFESDSLDQISSTIIQLNLKSNKLQTIHSSIFDSFPKLQTLLIEDNPFDCITDLCPLQQYLLLHPNDNKGLTCAKPADMKSRPLHAFNFCPEETTLLTTELTTPESEDIKIIKCTAPDHVEFGISVRPQLSDFTIKIGHNDQVVFQINEIPENNIDIMWFSESKGLEIVNYLWNVSTPTIILNNFKVRQPYIICLIDRMTNITSLFNCISLYVLPEEVVSNVWFGTAKKFKVITVISFVYVVCFILGIIFVYATLWIRSTTSGNVQHTSNE